MWPPTLRAQIDADFAECSTPAGCVGSAKILERPELVPVETRQGIAVVTRQVGSNVRRIVKFPHR